MARLIMENDSESPEAEVAQDVEQVVMESTDADENNKGTVKNKADLKLIVIAAALVLSIIGNVFLSVKFLQKRADYNEIAPKHRELAAVHADEYFVFPSLSVEGFERKVAAGDEFIAFISRPNCGSCQEISADFIDYCRAKGIEDKVFHVNVVYVNRDANAWTAFKERYGLTGTPSFVRFARGEVASALSWTESDGAPIDMITNWMEEQDNYLGLTGQ